MVGLCAGGFCLAQVALAGFAMHDYTPEWGGCSLLARGVGSDAGDRLWFHPSTSSLRETRTKNKVLARSLVLPGAVRAGIRTSCLSHCTEC